MAEEEETRASLSPLQIQIATYTNLSLTIVMDLVYILIIVVSSGLRQKPRHWLMISTVASMLIHAVIMLSAQVGYHTDMTSWVKVRILCDVMYVASGAFHEATLLLLSIIILERIHATRVTSFRLTCMCTALLVLGTMLVCHGWEGIVQHVIGSGTTSLQMGRKRGGNKRGGERSYMCYLDVSRHPLSIIYTAQDVTLLVILGVIGAAGLIVECVHSRAKGSLIAPSLSAIFVTSSKLPYVILNIGLHAWKPSQDVNTSLYFLEMAPGIVVPIIWLFADWNTFCRHCCVYQDDTYSDIDEPVQPEPDGEHIWNYDRDTHIFNKEEYFGKNDSAIPLTKFSAV